MSDIYFTKEGKGEKVLLFLHGWGADGGIFKFAVKALSERFTCYCLDLWGFGKSPMPPVSGWTVEDYSERIYLFCIAEGIEKLSIVAHSFGGRIATVFAAEHPNMCDKLLLCASAGMRRFSLLRTVKIFRFKLKKFLCRLAHIQPYCAASGSVDYNACENGLRNTFVKVVNGNLKKYAKNIQSETLLVWGDGDTQTPMWMAKKLEKYIANSCLIVLKGTHFVFLENASAFVEIIKAFMGV